MQGLKVEIEVYKWDYKEICLYEYYLRRERLEALELFARDLKELERNRLQGKEASIE